MSKIFTLFSSQSKFGVNLFFMGEIVTGGGEQKRDEKRTSALDRAEAYYEKINSMMLQGELQPVNIDIILRNLKELKDLLLESQPGEERNAIESLIVELEARLPGLKARDSIEVIIRHWGPKESLSPMYVGQIRLNLRRLRTLLPQLSSEEQEKLKGLLSQLQPGKKEDIESLIAELEAQLPGLEIAAYPIITRIIDIIDYWSKITLNPEYIDLMQESLKELEDLLLQLTPEQQEVFKYLLQRLQPREEETLEDLLRRLEDQLPSLNAVCGIIEINYWSSQPQPNPNAQAITKLMIAEFKDLLPKLQPEDKKRFKGLLGQLQPTEEETLEDLLRRLEA